MDNLILELVEQLESKFEVIENQMMMDVDLAWKLLNETTPFFDKLSMLNVDENTFIRLKYKRMDLRQYIYYANLEYVESYKIGKRLIDLLLNEEDKYVLELSNAYRIMSYVSERTGDFGQGIILAEKACEYAYTSGDIKAIVKSLIALAINNEQVGDIDSVIKIYEKGLEYAYNANEKRSIAVLLNNLSNVHMNLGNLQLAQNQIEEAIKIHEMIGFGYDYASFLNTVANVEYRLGHIEKTKEMINKILNLEKRYADDRGRIYTLKLLAAIEWEEGNYNDSKDHFEQALSECIDLGLKVVELSIYSVMAKTFEKSGHYKEAYEISQKRTACKNELLDENAQFAVRLKNLEYEMRIAQYETNLLKLKSEQLEVALEQQTEKLLLTQDLTIQTIAAMAEARDTETGFHITRTRLYVEELLKDLKKNDDFTEPIEDNMFELLHRSAPLHDIGKIGVPDSILLKPGKLTNAEFEEMKNHTTYGEKTLRIVDDALGVDSFMKVAREIAITHHEWWDGSGYPNGLKEREIPLSGRIMAIADVYDALISERPYKPAFSHKRAVEIMKEESGTHFDPEIMAVFLENHEKFEVIAYQFSDV